MTLLPSRALKLKACVASVTTEKQGHSQVWCARRGSLRTRSRASDANTDCVENALVLLFWKLGGPGTLGLPPSPLGKEQHRIELSWRDLPFNQTQCRNYDAWNATAGSACSDRGMKLKSFAMLLPCGIDVFSGVEFVCCPPKPASAQSATSTNKKGVLFVSY